MKNISLLLLGSALCGSLVAPAMTAPPGAQRRPTFVEHIAPIIHTNCTPCHRPGRATAFPLISYDDVRARGREIVEATRSRQMPPWSPERGEGFPALRDDMRLTDRQIATIGDWVDAGMPSGDMKRMPLPPVFPTGWALGIPDLTLSMPRTLSVPADTAERRFNVVLYLNFPDDRWISAIDYEPSAAGVVHHAMFFSAPTDLVVDDEDALPGFGGLLSGGRVDNLSERMVAIDAALESLGSWVPGGLVRVAPEGAGQRLPKHSNLVMQLHARGSDTGAIEDGRVAIYFTKTPALKTLTAVQVPPAFGMVAGLNIPPEASRYTLKDALTLPIDVEAIGARGYAHYAGREMRMTARLPNGSTRGLLRIPRWDFDRQDSYYFAAPVRLPKGTVVQTEISYDNSAANPRNASSPPRRIAWGPAFAEEMGSMTLLVSTAGSDAAAALSAARAQHVRELLIGAVRR